MSVLRRAGCGVGIVTVSVALLVAILVVAPVRLHAQPTLAVANVNTPCNSAPLMVGGALDTVVSSPDAEGFVSLFDGKSLRGWWENCRTTHSIQDTVNGAFWIADSVNHALYSQQANNYAGSILMTQKKYDHYELIFDVWPTFGNDAGVFNRVVPTGSTAGRTYQTGIDYIANSSVGGAYGEGGYGGSPAFNQDPYKFTSASNKTAMSIDYWTTFTAARNPISFGCPVTGCTAAQWTAVWDTAGWNQMRVKFFGGLVSGQRTKMQAWFRRVSNPAAPGPDNWVPTYEDSQNVVTPANPIGLQVHGTSPQWNRAGKGTWYRNIKIRPLDDKGVPLTPVSLREATTGDEARPRATLSFQSGFLTGTLPQTHRIVVSDMTGRVLQRFQGSPGFIHYGFNSVSRGVFTIQIFTSSGTQQIKAIRL